MDELILENENLVQEQDNLRNKGIDEGDKYKYQDAISASISVSLALRASAFNSLEMVFTLA